MIGDKMIEGDGGDPINPDEHTFEMADDKRPITEHPMFLRNCKLIKDYEEQWRKVPKENAVRLFISTVWESSDFNQDNLPFMFHAFENIYGEELTKELEKEWLNHAGPLRIIVREIEHGRD